jgi:16S rRNA G966 N2-methylase RsmD
MKNEVKLRDDFKVNKEGSFSITRPYESNQIIEIIQKHVGSLKNKIVTDATACMGGDLVSFSKVCRFVNGVEIDSENFELLVENAKRFKCQNVNLFCQDYLKIYDKLRQDIIYMDPPWGGVDYKTKNSISLKLGETHLWEILEFILKDHSAEHIFVKVPLNVSLDRIQYNSIQTIYNKNHCETFKLLVIDLRKNEFKP